MKAPSGSLESHGIRMSQNTMEQERVSFGFEDVPEGRTAVFIWSDVV